jgi:serine/threonine protein kinase
MFNRDSKGRNVIELTDEETKVFIRKKYYFCGRYDVHRGHPIHCSATAVVVNAKDYEIYGAFFDKYNQEHIDEIEDQMFTKEHFQKCIRMSGTLDTFLVDDEHIDTAFSIADINHNGKITKVEFVRYCEKQFGAFQKVVIKFMMNKDQYEREVKTRVTNNLSATFVVSLLPSPTESEFEAGLLALSNLKLPNGKSISNYKYGIVMEAASRSMDVIASKERPDNTRIRSMLSDIIKAIQHLHENGVVHGDIKLMNVIRSQDTMKLIDMDAATKIEEDSYIGCKFSSGGIALIKIS